MNSEKIVAAIRKVRKALVAAVGVAAIVLGPDSAAYVDIVGVLTALGVYRVPNGE